MSGILLEYEGRRFWSKYCVDIWLYHMSHIVVSATRDLPQDIIDYSHEQLRLTKKGYPDWMFNFLPIYKDNVPLLIQLCKQLLYRLDNFDDFLMQEAQKIGCAVTDFQQAPEKFTDKSDVDILGYMTLSRLQQLKTFGYLIIKLLTNDNWTVAYTHSYVNPIIVKLIDYLNSIKLDGNVLLGRIEHERFNGNYLHYVSDKNTDCDITWHHSNSTTYGMPDLIVSYNSNIGDSEYDYLFLVEAQENRIKEHWECDHDRKTTRVILNFSSPSHNRHSADNDFYSQALNRNINLKFLYDINWYASLKM